MTPSNELIMADYITQNGLELCELRVLIEGAFYLYKEELSPIHEKHPAASVILSSIGSALFGLHQRIIQMQTAYAEEVQRRLSEDS